MHMAAAIERSNIFVCSQSLFEPDLTGLVTHGTTLNGSYCTFLHALDVTYNDLV